MKLSQGDGIGTPKTPLYRVWNRRSVHGVRVADLGPFAIVLQPTKLNCCEIGGSDADLSVGRHLHNPMRTSYDITAMNKAALAELGAAIEGVSSSEVDSLLDALSSARRIALHGVGREGLMMRALAMRLFHLGLDAHVVGEMTTPPVGDGDLLLVSAGPGHFATIAALCEAAAVAGAKTACITAVPDEHVPSTCDHVLVIPAQTMASDTTSPTSLLPMGSVYEGAQFLLFEYLVLLLRERLGISAEAMRTNHTNLE